MTILPRDATAGGVAISGVVGRPRTAFSGNFDLSGIDSKMLRSKVQLGTLRACIYKENPSGLGFILPLFDRLHESS
ncbi:hypothetical protein [Paraburkholderia ginsengiterrae]|uniref:hypothetical protein n=1 Tax=Paraburkholderia ginsengiterrae TaxID=1462993 RepID=UPI0013F4E5F4|nr:hypothetical protein [Paraburkholderia ginsengiterrae]